MTVKLLKIFIILSVIFIGSTTIAQQIPMSHFSKDHGLINSAINHMYQDRKGYVWFATFLGLSRFDGIHFKNFDPSNSGLGHPIVKTITEDSEGKLWVGYQGGIGVFRNGRFENFSTGDGLTGKSVYKVYPDPVKGIWVLTDRGVNYFDGLKFKRYELEGILSGNSTISINGKNEVFVATRNGLKVLKDRNGIFIKAEGFDISPVAHIYHRKENAIYLIDESNLYLYRNEKLKKIAESPLKDTFYGMDEGRDGTLFLYSTKEIWNYRKKGNSRHYSASILDHPSISHVIEDHEGNLFIGQWSGFSLIQNRDMINFNTSVAGKIVYGLKLTEERDLLYAGKHGAVRYSRQFKQKKRYGKSFVMDMLEDGETVYLATYREGLQIFTLDGKLQTVLDGEFNAIYKDSRGKIWVGSSSGLYSFHDGDLKLELDDRSGLESSVVWSIFQDSRENIWIGTQSGIAMHDGKKWNLFQDTELFSGRQVTAISEAPDGTVFFGTLKGLLVYRNNNFSISQPFDGDAVNNLYFDRYKKLWATTVDGIYRINGKNEIEYYFEYAKGKSNQSNIRVVVGDDKFIYFGTYNGVYKLSLDIKERESVKPQLDLSGIEINEKDYGLKDLKRPLEYSSNNLKFHFNGIHFSTPETLRYQFFLEGLDKRWKKETKINQAVFTNIPPGNYTFHVKAIVGENMQSDVQKISFYINPPWWKTWWANLIYFSSSILFIVFTLFVISRLKRKIKAQTVVLEKQLKEIELSRNKEIVANTKKSIFLANMSHEIRTPLNAVINLSKHLLEKNMESEYLDEIRIIKNSGDHLLTLINDILDMSKIESGELTLQKSHFNIFDSLNNTIESLRIAAVQKNLFLKLEYDVARNIIVEADEGRIKQIFFNLINNAIKFTKSGGVTVIASCSEKEGRYHFDFAIKDTGIGIRKEDISFLFRYFKQIDSDSSTKYEGTGLGLAISKDLVELMEGEISVESIFGVGSVFSFFLKLDAGNIDEIEKEEAMLSVDGDSNNLKILMAEDNKTNVSVAKIYFEDQGLNLVTVSNGKEVLDILKLEDFDLILMDLEMPVMNGIESTKRIRSGEVGEKYREIPIIALSAHSTKDHRKKCYDAGINFYMAKPIDFPALFKTINSIASSGRLLNRDELKEKTIRREAREIRFKKIFIEEIPEILEAIGSDIESGDFEEIRKTAHKHKSSTGQLGFENILEILKTIESNAVSENMDFIKSSFRELKAELTEVEKEIREMI